MRVLIDCSYVDFRSPPTGIPRVVLKYIETGYAWGEAHGVEVLPVVPTADGLFITRPIPGAAPPPKLRRLRDGTSRDGAMAALKTLCRYGRMYVGVILHHVIGLFTAVFRVRPLRLLGQWLDDGIQKLLALPERWLDQRELLPFRVRPTPGDVLFAPAYWHDVDPAIYRKLRRDGVKVVILVHDILPVTHRRFYNHPWRDTFREHLKAAAICADAFVCVSAYTRTTLSTFLAEQRLPAPPIHVAYNGFEPLTTGGGSPPALLRVVIERASSAPLLMVGSIEPKKNHIMVVETLERMWAEGYPRDLIIVGRRGWLDQDIVERMTGSPVYGERLFWFDGLDDASLAYCFRHSHAHVFCSVAEGFGIPMIEAASFGKPTIALDTPIAREVLGEVGVYFDGVRVTLAERLLELEDGDRHAQASRRAAALCWPTWTEYTPRVFDLLARVGAGEVVAPTLIPLRPDSGPITPRATAVGGVS